MENDKIHDYTDAYLESYLRALDKTHNPDLAIQTAMGVTMVLRMIRCAERTEAASAAADQSNGGTFWSHDAASSEEPARGGQSRRQRDRERRR